jgi:hypothetical protein
MNDTPGDTKTKQQEGPVEQKGTVGVIQRTLVEKKKEPRQPTPRVLRVT